MSSITGFLCSLGIVPLFCKPQVPYMGNCNFESDGYFQNFSVHQSALCG